MFYDLAATCKYKHLLHPCIGVNSDTSGGALTMASAEREPITGSGGRAPSGDQEQSQPLVGVSEGEAP